jgi:NAD(P)H-nitrite reductase large subunit
MKDWEKMGKDEVLCPCRNVTKQMIMRAVAFGARTPVASGAERTARIIDRELHRA